jgi:DNA-binding SARP family transcriptional activator
VGRVLATGGAELADDSASWLDWLPPGLVEDDPWVMIATARRAAATGRFTAALDRYQRVDELHAAARDIAQRERAVIAAWLDPGAAAPTGWAGRLRAVLRAHPVAEPPAEVTLAGTVVGMAIGPPAGGPAAGDALVDGVAAVLAGRLAAGSGRLLALADDPDVPLALAVGARLALAFATALAGRPVAAELAELSELVELVDVPWLSALALAAATGLGDDGAGTRRALSVAAERDAAGDPWGAAGARLMAALGTVLAGGGPVAELGDLAARFRRLEATVLEAWCRAWQATALARTGDPGAAEAARTAERLADRAGVPGARVWALTVSAQLAAGDEAAEHRARAAEVRRRWDVDVAVPGPAPAGGSPVAPAAAAAPGVVAGGGRGARPARPGLRVRCLGGFRLELDGTPVDVAAVKPRARSALRVLAAHGGRPVHTETLVDALWPDLDAAAGKRNLQVAVSSLRRLLDHHRAGAGALVRREGPAYVLALPDVGCADVAVFAAACTEARDAARAGDADRVLDAGDRALVAYGGDLLPEEGPADWAVERRRQLAADATEVAQAVAEAALDLGLHDVAASACARGLEIDRYHDGLWRRLVDAQERSGDLAAAARTQERYHEVLRELGLPAEPAAAGSDAELALDA